VSEAKDLGLIVRPLNPQEQRRYEVKGGLLVEDVLIGSPAYEAGIRAGDIILSINLHRVYTKAQMDNILERLISEHKDTATFLVDRDGQNIFVTVNLK
jgi:Trypsin-like serine proteases, typically periplasmic, contain C-terminal PDZ domain